MPYYEDRARSMRTRSLRLRSFARLRGAATFRTAWTPRTRVTARLPRFTPRQATGLRTLLRYGRGF